VLEIRELRGPDLAGAAVLLGRAMRDNPLHVRVFGDDPARRERDLTRLFAALLPRQIVAEGAVLGAWIDGRLAGACGMSQPGRRQPTFWQTLQLAPRLLGRSGIGLTLRVARWASTWSLSDTTEPHWHLGPVGVEPELQGHGIGGALVQEFCRRMDEMGSVSYLETDKHETVGFYERFGFQVIGDDRVLGVPNWFMVRTP
jgi:ribosomal protein S18 acetylase RimI-like enzyme